MMSIFGSDTQLLSGIFSVRIECQRRQKVNTEQTFLHKLTTVLQFPFNESLLNWVILVRQLILLQTLEKKNIDQSALLNQTATNFSKNVCLLTEKLRFLPLLSKY